MGRTMGNPDDEAARAADLRRRAEVRARERPPKDLAEEPSAELLRVIHELQVHQIELELQNESLRRAQADLAEARDRFVELYDEAPVGYCTLSRNGIIRDANHAALEMLACPSGRILGHPLTSFIHQEDQQVYHSHLTRFQTTREPFTCDLRLLPRRGAPLWASLTLKASGGPGPAGPAAPARGSPPALAILVDLRARKRADEERDRLEAQVRLAQRLESIGRLAGDMAHQFNNLLGAMAGNLDLLRPELSSRPALARLDTLDQLVARAAEQVGRIMSFAGRGTTRFQSLDLNLLMEDMAGLLRASLPTRVSLSMDLGSALPPMAGDPGQVQQVALNLVLNAAEALGAGGGTVTLRTALVRITEDDLRTGLPGQVPVPGPYLALAVSDPGPGLTPEVRERMFDPYFSTRFAGRGLGLPVVHSVLASHGGGIQVDSGEGRRTILTALFPAQAEPAATPGEAAPRAPEPAEAPALAGKVLVVEDEEVLREVAAEALGRMGFQVLEAADGLEALRVFEAHREGIRLVLMDFSMPNMDGERAYRELRRAGAMVPIVMTSGFGAEDALRPLRGRGVAGFLAKPYRLADLADAVHAALDRTGSREPVPWLREFETGHPALDASHREVLQAFNRVLAAAAGGGPEDPERALARLIDAAGAHFALEDSLMQATGCAEGREHQVAHARLMARIQDLAGRIRRGEERFTPPVLDFIQDWVVCHIQAEDQPMARHLRRTGH